MNNWIEINLPWKKSIHLDEPEFPLDAAQKACRERFGKTQDDIYDDFEFKHDKCHWEIQSEIESEESNILMKEMGIDSTYNLSDEELNKFHSKVLRRTLDINRNPIMFDLKVLEQLDESMENLISSLPEVEAWIKEREKIKQQKEEKEKTISFYASDLRRPGVLIEVQHKDNNDNTIIRKYLLGNTNCLGGVCDDCTAFEDDAIVLRAKILIKPEELE